MYKDESIILNQYIFRLSKVSIIQNTAISFYRLFKDFFSVCNKQKFMRVFLVTKTSVIECRNNSLSSSCCSDNKIFIIVILFTFYLDFIKDLFLMRKNSELLKMIKMRFRLFLKVSILFLVYLHHLLYTLQNQDYSSKCQRLLWQH